MSTTVPQNLKGNNIAGRHTPTRNSLRHSRMLVMNKNFQGNEAPNPLRLNHPKIAKFLSILQIIVGVIITSIGLWILLWAPNTRTQDNPYWSGLSLILPGIFVVSAVRFKRVKRRQIKEKCFNLLKICSFALTKLAIIICFLALVFAAIHLNYLMAASTKCVSTNILVANAACVCTFGSSETNSTLFLTEIEEGSTILRENQFQYRDLSCGEVTSAWKYILLISATSNCLGSIISAILLVILYQNKNKKTNYATVRSDEF